MTSCMLGLVTRLLATQVGSTGKVYAEEVSPSFLSILSDMKDRESLSNVHVVEGSMKDIGIHTDNECDLALLCDVYHHFEYPVTCCKYVLVVCEMEIAFACPALCFMNV